MEVKQLSYRHTKETPYFFKELSFSLEPGKMHALHGKNGCGKSILLSLLSGRNPPRSVVQGDVTGSDRTLLVNQRFDQMIADQFSFGENLQFASMSRFPAIFSRLKKASVSNELLSKFNIDFHQPVARLSGGQRQILALLMALQQKKGILLLDEPTATLDEENARSVFEFLRMLTLQDTTLLVVCHDKELIEEYANGDHFNLKISADGTRTLSKMR